MQELLQYYNKQCNVFRMDPIEPSGRLPAAAVRELKKASKSDWQRGVPVSEMLVRANRVAESFLPPHGEAGPGAGRVQRAFTERSFRHYQTLGCIDPPAKEGRRALYQFRHFVQALLVRKLLWEHVSAGRIAALMAGRGTSELESMLLGGVEMVARTGDSESSQLAELRQGPALPAGKWSRFQILAGVELNVLDGRPRLKPAELRELLERVKGLLG